MLESTTERGPAQRRRARRWTATLTAGLVTAALTVVAPQPAQAVSVTDFARLRQCESGGNYRINTGNGYYGAYQFNLMTWRGLGYSGYPHRAAPHIQDEAAWRLYDQRGWYPWPACSRKLGLRDDRQRASRSGTTTGYRTVAPGVVVDLRAARDFRKSTPLPYRGRVLKVQMANQVRADVRAWQLQMRKRGYQLAIDGRYSSHDAAVAAAFQRKHGLPRKSPAVVGPVVWRATWTKSNGF